jgi:hypothetical protein
LLARSESHELAHGLIQQQIGPNRQKTFHQVGTTLPRPLTQASTTVADATFVASGNGRALLPLDVAFAMTTNPV